MLNKSRNCDPSECKPPATGAFLLPWECPERGTDGHGATPGDADGISPQGCECGRGNGAPGHPGRQDGGTHGQGAPGSRIMAQAATNEPRMDWAPILQEKGHGAHPGTHHGAPVYIIATTCKIVKRPGKIVQDGGGEPVPEPPATPGRGKIDRGRQKPRCPK